MKSRLLRSFNVTIFKAVERGGDGKKEKKRSIKSFLKNNSIVFHAKIRRLIVPGGKYVALVPEKPK